MKHSGPIFQYIFFFCYYQQIWEINGCIMLSQAWKRWRRCERSLRWGH